MARKDRVRWASRQKSENENNSGISKPDEREPEKDVVHVTESIADSIDAPSKEVEETEEVASAPDSGDDAESAEETHDSELEEASEDEVEQYKTMHGDTESSHVKSAVGGSNFIEDSSADELPANEVEYVPLMETTAEPSTPAQEIETQLVDSLAEHATVEQTELDPDDPCAMARAEFFSAQETANNAMKSLSKAQVHIRSLERAQVRLARDLDEGEKELEEIRTARDSLGEWTGARRHSFAWQFAASLNHERNLATEERQAAKRWLDGVQPTEIDTDRIAKQAKAAKRQTFVLLLSILGIFVVAVAVLQMVRTQGRVEYVDIPTPWPMIGFAALAYLAIALNIWFQFEKGDAERTLQRNRALSGSRLNRSVDLGGHGLLYLDFVRRTLVRLIVVILVVLAVIWLKSALPILVSQHFPGIWAIWVIGAVLYAALEFTTWFEYYSGLSKLRFQLNSLIHESTRQKRRYLHAANEEARLKAIHALVPDYLEALARPMHKLWVVDESGLNRSHLRPDGEFLPASVSIADATVGAPEETALLSIRSRGVLVRPGWLTAAIGSIVDAIALSEGLPATSMNLEALAADPGDSRRGVRRIIAERSADPSVLERVGRETLKLTSVGVQRSAIRSVRPHVKLLRPEELGQIDVASTRFVEEYANLIGWSDFLAEALSPSVPFSLLAFSERGLEARSHVVHRSSALVPQDLVENPLNHDIELVAVVETGSTPLDLVVRIDQSDWLEPDCLEIFSSVELAPEPIPPREPSIALTILDA